MKQYECKLAEQLILANFACCLVLETLTTTMKLKSEDLGFTYDVNTILFMSISAILQRNVAVFVTFFGFIYFSVYSTYTMSYFVGICRNVILYPFKFRIYNY